MAKANGTRGLIAVDKMGTKILFLNPTTYATETVLDGFPRTVHELLVVPETGLAYVPIFGDGIHGRNPNPGHLLCIFDLAKRTHIGDIDLRPYIAPHTLKLGPDGLIYVTCENSAVVAVIDRVRHRRYQKTMQRTKHLYAHDEANDVNVGDKVRVMETRPLSKTKRWRVVEVMERAR